MKRLTTLFFLIFVAVTAHEADGSTIDRLIAGLYSHNPKTQMSSVEGLVKLREGAAIGALVDFVFVVAEDWKVKIRVIQTLGNIADPRISDRLVTLFNNPFLNENCPSIKWHTAIALGKHFNKGTRAVDTLIEALDHDDLMIREAAVQSLGKIGDSRAVPFLIQQLTNKSFAIKYSAIKALENIGDSRAIPFLKKVAGSDNDAQVKKAALSALKNFDRKKANVSLTDNPGEALRNFGAMLPR
jgi:HEAT repeat protein